MLFYNVVNGDTDLKRPSHCSYSGVRGRLPRPSPRPPRGGRVRAERGDQLDHRAPPCHDIATTARLLDM